MSVHSMAYQRAAYLLCVCVIAISVSGYFVGIQSPMSAVDHRVHSELKRSPSLDASGYASDPVIAATEYRKMIDWSGSQVDSKLETIAFLPEANMQQAPGEAEKRIALAGRSRNRAFNGAPPTIPHTVSGMTHASCATCHVQGGSTRSMRIPRMSHAFLENCTQCHVAANEPLPGDPSHGNTFEGLPAPFAGPRAFQGAPPVIPHSTWMRTDCLACHGTSGPVGIRTAHPYRTNCQQCHAPSEQLEQNPIFGEPRFLRQLGIEETQARKANQ